MSQMGTIIHTTSSNREWETCKRRWKYKHIDLRRPVVKGKALNVGTALHVGLEVWARGGGLDEMFSAMDAFLSTVDFFTSDDDGPVERERIRAMLTAYYQRWQPTRGQWHTLDVEREFTIELVPGIKYSGKMDWVAKYGEDIYLADHKSTSDKAENPGDDFWQRLAIDKQISAYSEAVYRLYGKYPKILWDVLRKPSGGPKGKERIAKRKTESESDYEARKASNLETLDEFRERLVAEMLAEPDKYLVRREVYRNRDQHLAIIEELAETCKSISNYSGVYPRNDSACKNGYGSCQYLSVCCGSESLESDYFEKYDTAHPELSGV